MHLAGSWILLIFVALMAAVALVLLHLTQAGDILHQRIPDRPHRRLLLASISFFITFLAARLLVYSITHHVGPFGYVLVGGRHIHHLVWGILLLLLSGYATLAEAGTGATPGSIFVSRLLSIAYGVGAALTLDEFAIWLTLDPNAYWSAQDRESIDAIILFGALLAIGTWGAPLLRSKKLPSA
ncbi:MAG: hypothetical protein PW789_08330 [Edaphobacter sp.]|uniref:hypothetical protein n=1 Tax=Edaphobacter sp. TaxID=1934404 RepID=UPI0023975B33|nr:hypothetical protein [Edaphobacter sp.]MDE1176602.1 hypothetical protein [Edaphobacter sp.]